MYNLLKFLIKHQFFIIFLILELFSFSLIVQFNSYQQVKFVNAANQLTGSVFSIKSTITDFFKLKKINQELAAENAKLKSSSKQIHYIEIPHLTNDTVFSYDSLIIDTTFNLNYIPAKVISNSVNKQQNIIYINKGSIDGFYTNMGVVNRDGVVGIVRDISENYATVVPIINRNLNINAKIKDSGYFGNMTWDGKNPLYAQLYDIPNHTQPQKGDTIVTSGFSKIFAEGNIIGYIDEVYDVPGKSFIKINVALAVGFGNLNFVYGLKNSLETKLDSLHLEN